MDLPSLTTRLTSLSLTSPSTGTTTPLNTYFFTPKSGSKIGEQELKLVVVAIEEGKNVGAAKSVAMGVGLKDMRAIAPKDLEALLGRKREEASPLSLPTSLAPTTLILTSSTLSTLTLSLPSPLDPTQSLALSSAEWTKTIASLEKEGAAVREVEFAIKVEGAEFVAPPKPAAAPKKEGKDPVKDANRELENKSGVQLGITVKKEAAVFGEWYQQVLVKGEMLDYYDVSGCYILKPWSYGIWQEIQTWFDVEIKALGVQNAYFPMFVSQKALEREKDHIEGFAPEVAWVTRAGQSDLEEPIAIRPTSETVMYPAYAKWIRSYRDLPLKLNQWNSVVRWEFKNPQPFLRTREFLWQEGHTAFLTKPEADTEVLQILDLYRRVYEELLAVPVIPGVKSEKEKFAGGLYTTTVEGFIPVSGRGIQGGTSHCLGQNFSKMFNIVVEDPKAKEAGGSKLHVWQNSWGLSTRSIGVMVMVHSDDKGLVLPPRVAQLQVVIIPTGFTTQSSPETRQSVEDKVVEMEKTLLKVGVKAKADLRDGYTPGFKYSDWELKGVPIRLEVGPKDLANSSTMSVRRDTGAKEPLSLDDLATSIPAFLEKIQAEMLAKARKEFNEHIKVVYEWKDFVKTLNGNNVIALPWCEREVCEEQIKERSAKESVEGAEDEKAPSAGAKSLCIPHDQSKYPALELGKTTCPNCGEHAKRWTLFGRSY